MKLSRLQIASAAALMAFAGAWMFAPAQAQIHTAPQSQTMGIPCRISFDETTHGGDWFTIHGEAALTQIAPQAGGSFVAMGQGQGTITYHPTVAGCHLTSSDTFTASYMVIVESENGDTATVDFSSQDPSHRFDLLCPTAPGGRTTTSDYDPPEPPSVTVELHEGVTPFSHELRGPRGESVGDRGNVTLHYCTPENSNGH
jgi:hypothetical protein